MTAEPTRLLTAQRPYLVGIGGSGLSAIARWLLQRRGRVFGYDLEASPAVAQLMAAGARVTVGPPPATLPADVDLLVFSDAIQIDHPIRRAADGRHLPSLSYPQALGQLTSEFPDRLVVTGTNGKSTTAALAGWLLTEAGQDPSVVIGSQVPQFGGNVRFGQRSLVICEGDEYRNHFLELEPTLALVTNLSLDHPDYFPDLEAVSRSFHAFVDRLPANGQLLLNADDPLLRSQFGQRVKHVATFSVLDRSADLFLRALPQPLPAQRIEVWVSGRRVGETVFPLPGRDNLSNAAAASLLAHERGVPTETIGRALSTFQGLRRRFEVLGSANGATIVTDFAHHPASLRGVIQASRERFPNQRIVAVFQPHQRHRVQAFADAFVEALTLADASVVSEVFTVPGRDLAASEATSAARLTDGLRARGQPCRFAATLEETALVLQAYQQPNTVLLFIGAGSIDTLARRLVQ